MRVKNCILIVPASGFSSRFGEADKLLADLGGAPLASHMAKTTLSVPFRRKIAVVPSRQGPGAELFASYGFDLAINTSPALGQMHSIEMGARHITAQDRAKVLGICIMLADMPLVPAQHVMDLLEAADEHDVVKTTYCGHLQPPAIFTGRAMQAWLNPSSEGPYLSHLAMTGQEAGLPLASPYGDDVDTQEDLARLSSLMSRLR